MDTEQPWFAIQNKPRNEKKIGYLLRQKGFESFIPTYRQKRRWSDRTVEIDWPLFPMYVFCRFNTSEMWKILSTPGVVKIVGFGGKLAEVSIEEIEALQLLAQSSFLREPWRYLPEGTGVQVETGPLAGAQGIICHDENDRRLIISVTLLQRSVAIRLDESTIVSVLPGPNERRPGLSAESDIAFRLLQRN
jgi:transcription antitermination factor NusG